MNDLQKSWDRAWSSIGARGNGRNVYDLLVAHYSEPHRKYHTVQHLSECIATFDPVCTLAENPGEREMALWFHDAIYETRRHDNEQLSAIWARSSLLQSGATAESAERVFILVMATRHTALPERADEKLLVDIDLSILGAPSERFSEYERQIRDEYAFVPGWLFRRKRRAILRTFLERSCIFSTAHFRSILEERARENLQRAISNSGG